MPLRKRFLKAGTAFALALVLGACAASRRDVPQIFQPETPVPKASALNAEALLATAQSYLGTPYRFGGNRASATDCSGFVQMVFRQHGIALPHITRRQAHYGTFVDKDDALEPGDLVFFQTYRKGPSHVGIYLGDGQFIHASSGSRKVIISRMNEAYYAKRFLGAKRIF